MSEFGFNSKNQFEEVDLREVYIKNYGVKMEMPAFYIHQAKLVPHFKNYIIILAWHIVPKGFSQTIQTTYLDNSVEESTF